MNLSKILYPDYDGGYGPGDYSPIVEYFGTVAVRVDDAAYQGDTRVLYADFSYLQFGWGSCSGCDALQACSSHEDVDQLVEQLRSQIKHFGSAEAALAFFKTHDWKGDYSWHQAEQREFITKAIAYLESRL